MRHVSPSVIALALLCAGSEALAAAATVGVAQAAQAASQSLAAQNASERVENQVTAAVQQAAFAHQLLAAVICGYPGGACPGGSPPPATTLPPASSISELVVKTNSLLSARSAVASSLEVARAENARMFALWQPGSFDAVLQQASALVNNQSLSQAERTAASAFVTAIQEFLRSAATLRSSSEASYATAIGAENTAASASREVSALVSQLNDRKIFVTDLNGAARRSADAAAASKDAAEEARRRKDAAIANLRRFLELIRSINPQI